MPLLLKTSFIYVYVLKTNRISNCFSATKAIRVCARWVQGLILRIFLNCYSSLLWNFKRSGSGDICVIVLQKNSLMYVIEKIWQNLLACRIFFKYVKIRQKNPEDLITACNNFSIKHNSDIYVYIYTGIKI